jgi:hypothetical protein
MVIKTKVPILGPPFLWDLFPGIEPEDDGSGTKDEARAGISLHFCNGVPQRDGFCAKDESGKPESNSGIRPERMLPETLKSWR